jgi:hypothetical protein
MEHRSEWAVSPLKRSAPHEPSVGKSRQQRRSSVIAIGGDVLHRFIQRSHKEIWLWTLAVLAASSPAFGQRTQVTDAGGGRKVETVYNAAGQAVEVRTLGPNGELEQTSEFEYRPGYQVPQQTTTSYWSDGKTMHKRSRVEYDDNANFTSQVDGLFDASGKQIAGNKLTHDPFTGVYKCYKWVPGPSGYEQEVCPKPEEEESSDEGEREMTRAEAMKDLSEARETQRSQEKISRMEPKPPVRPPITTAEREVGVVLPAELHAGQRVSGSVDEDADIYEGDPGLQVVRMKVPFESQGSAATLGGWSFLAPNTNPQRADGAVSFVVPGGSAELTITLRQTGNPAHAVSRAISIEKSESPAAPKQPGFEASPVCFEGQLCPVKGPFSGDSTRTFAAFANQPGLIVAETSSIAYISPPDGMRTGFTHLLISSGSSLAALPVDVVRLQLTPPARKLQQGETLVMHLIIDGAEDLPDDYWHAGTFAPFADAGRARRLAPGFDPSSFGDDGVILAVVRNDSPESVSMRDAKNQSYVFGLTQKSFPRGEFKYNFVLEFARAGGYSLRGIALPFLAPVKGRVFSLSSGAPSGRTHPSH